MNALIIGGDSNLGQALYVRLTEAGHEVTRTTRRPLTANLEHWGWVYFNLMDPQLPAKLFNSVEVVYILAAITGILRCEEDPLAWHVNAEAPVLLAQAARARGWHVVFMSSGTVERAQHTASARQKAYADLAMLLLGGCVVRPLPHVPPESYSEMAKLLVKIGEERRVGVVRWRADGSGWWNSP